MNNHTTSGNSGKPGTIPAFLFILSISALLFFSSAKIEASSVKADKVVVIKSKRIMLLLRDGGIFKTYKVALGKQPKGNKMTAGDQKTPEGIYRLDKRNPNSRFHMAIHISYPNEADLANARSLGVLPGNEIMIHGLPDDLAEIGKLHRRWDWTDGCIAVSNAEMDEIWQLVPDGTPIEIKP